MKISRSRFLKKLFLAAFSVVCLIVFESSLNAQTVLVNYDFASSVSGATCNSTTMPLTSAPGVTSTFTTGSGVCTTPAGTAAASPPAFVANGNNQAVSITGFSTGSTNFFQFQLNGVASFQNFMLFFQTRRSGTGPVNADVQYSTDGTTFTTFQTVQPQNSSSSFAAFTIDLSSVSAIEGQPTVFFRILGRDGTGGSGTFVIDNFQVRAFSSTAAGATIGGRLITTRGRAISYVRLMLSGGELKEPIYATSSAFGYYQFPEVATGETYILQIFSRRYTFNPASRVINLNENLTDADFVGAENWLNNSFR